VALTTTAAISKVHSQRFGNNLQPQHTAAAIKPDDGVNYYMAKAPDVNYAITLLIDFTETESMHSLRTFG